MLHSKIDQNFELLIDLKSQHKDAHKKVEMSEWGN